MGARLGELAERLSWDVSDESLIVQAVSHRSWCAENPEGRSNERLEFLGDSVLGMVVADHVFRTYPDIPEGELTKVRAAVVNSVSLAEVAGELGLGKFILLGKGEDQSGGREKPSILADATEALIGAVYIDRGWAEAERLVMELFGPRIEAAAAGPGGQDYKTRLQEMCARCFDQLPRYHLTDEGPDHAKVFTATVYVRGEPHGHGSGRSKKQAEQAAAKQAWEALGSEPGGDGSGPVVPGSGQPGPVGPGSGQPGPVGPGSGQPGSETGGPGREPDSA